MGQVGIASIGLNSTVPMTYRNRMSLFMKTGNLEGTLSDSPTIVELAAEDALSVAKREVIQGMLGDSDSVIKDLLKALE